MKRRLSPQLFETFEITDRGLCFCSGEGGEPGGGSSDTNNAFDLATNVTALPPTEVVAPAPSSPSPVSGNTLAEAGTTAGA